MSSFSSRFRSIMAGAEGGDRSFNPRAHQLKLSLNLPASIDVSRSLGELQSVAQEIQRQKYFIY